LLRSADSLVVVSLSPRRCSWRLFFFVVLFSDVFDFFVSAVFVVPGLGGFGLDLFAVDGFVNPKGSVA